MCICLAFLPVAEHTRVDVGCVRIARHSVAIVAVSKGIVRRVQSRARVETAIRLGAIDAAVAPAQIKQVAGQSPWLAIALRQSGSGLILAATDDGPGARREAEAHGHKRDHRRRSGDRISPSLRDRPCHAHLASFQLDAFY
jgi:hypothetical protein